MSDASLMRGLGGRGGFGNRPALIVVDLSLGFTDPDSALGADLSDVVEETGALIGAARSVGAPVVFTTVAYGDLERVAASQLLRKFPGALSIEPNSRWTLIDPRLGRLSSEPVITKVFPSAFFGTNLSSYLSSAGVDSIVVAGASTSGCVRATVVDGVSHGYAVVVARDAVGDRSPSAHVANLVDMNLKYADVLETGDVLELLSSVSAR